MMDVLVSLRAETVLTDWTYSLSRFYCNNKGELTLNVGAKLQSFSLGAVHGQVKLRVLLFVLFRQPGIHIMRHYASITFVVRTNKGIFSNLPVIDFVLHMENSSLHAYSEIAFERHAFGDCYWSVSNGALDSSRPLIF